MPQKKSSKKKYKHGGSHPSLASSESAGFDLAKFFRGKDPQQLPAYKAAVAKAKAKAKAKKMVHKPIAQIHEEGVKRYKGLGDTTASTRARQVKAAEKSILERAAKAKKPVVKKAAVPKKPAAKSTTTTRKPVKPRPKPPAPPKKAAATVRKPKPKPSVPPKKPSDWRSPSKTYKFDADAIAKKLPKRGAAAKKSWVSSQQSKYAKLHRLYSNIAVKDQKNTLADARKAGHLYYWKEDGTKMAAVTKDMLKESGYKTLTAYMNAQERRRSDRISKKRRK